MFKCGQRFSGVADQRHRDGEADQAEVLSNFAHLELFAALRARETEGEEGVKKATWQMPNLDRQITKEIQMTNDA